MLKSMTGFGEGEVTDERGTMSVAIKSVNHRYLDLSFRLPYAFHAFEPAMRKRVQEKISRGKLDISLYFKSEDQGEGHLQFDRQAALTAFEGLKALQELTGTIVFNKAAVLAGMEGVFVTKRPERAADALQTMVMEALSNALDALLEERQREGEALKSNVTDLLHEMDTLLSQLETPMLDAPALLEKKLKERIETLLGEQTDEFYPGQRLAAEIALLVDKQAIDEEYVRLKSHVQGFRDALILDEAIGKRLDFLAQEMNREANTIAAKGTTEINRLALDLKHAIEQLREQVQNIE